MRDPSVLDFTKQANTPAFEIIQITIDSGITDGLLLQLRNHCRIDNQQDATLIDARAESAARIANALDEPCLLWNSLNNEGDELEN